MLIHERHEVAQILEKASQEITTIVGKPVRVIAYNENEISISENTRRDMILRNIISEVCGFNWSQVISKSRERELVVARQLYCVFAKKLLKYSLKTIAQNIGRDDHSTVIHSTQTIQDLIDTNDESIISKYNVIAERINKIIYESKA